MTRRVGIRVAIGVAVVILLALAARRIDVPRLAGGHVKGDESTYVAMALSLGVDGDLKYERRDLTRFTALFGEGPEGIFLKKMSNGELTFGKAFAFPALAAPFARLGGLGGILLLNMLL